MTKSNKKGTSSVWVGLMTVGILACLGGIAYTFYMIQQEAGEDGESRMVADELRILSQTISLKARETEQGQASTFSELQGNIVEFRDLMGELQSIGLDNELSSIQAQWLPVEQSTKTLVEAGPRIVFTHGVSEELEKNIKPIQSEFAQVVDILRDESVSSDTIVAAQKTLWLTERIARNIEKFWLVALRAS